jgi:membrane-anchored glycerophosphoryl diester phosphodiesterase (GDPDase)
MSFSFTRQILGEAWRDVRTCWPSLLLYNLFFQLFSVIILLPVTTWMGQWVVRRSGATAISNTAIISFIFSPVGIVWAAFTAVTTLVLIWAAVAGMLRICWAVQQNQRISATEALIHTVFLDSFAGTARRSARPRSPAPAGARNSTDGGDLCRFSGRL